MPCWFKKHYYVFHNSIDALLITNDKAENNLTIY